MKGANTQSVQNVAFFFNYYYRTEKFLVSLYLFSTFKSFQKLKFNKVINLNQGFLSTSSESIETI